MAGTDRTLTLSVFARRKREGRKLVLLTAYDLASARIGVAGGVDALLVGDSLGMVVQGHGTTLPVTMDDMVRHTQAVVRARPQVPVIADMPYGSFHVSAVETVRNGLRLVKDAGAQAVKLEGGRNRADAIAALLDAEIPVMGHLGLTPQSINRLGGYRVQGRGDDAASRLLDEAVFLAESGCFAMVLECMPGSVARRISETVAIPTIGIGAGAGCDGQVLVFHDLLGLLDGPVPRFVRRYAELGRAAAAAVAAYAADVRTGAFPDVEHEYGDAPSGRRGADPGTAGGPIGYLDQVDGDEDPAAGGEA